MAEIHEYAQEDVVIVLLGNKADMTSERAVRLDEGECLAKVEHYSYNYCILPIYHTVTKST